MLDVTWWSVFLTLRLSHLLSLPVCLPLSLCGVVDCGVVVLSLVLCSHIPTLFIMTFDNTYTCFNTEFNLQSIFLSLSAEDNNWFPKENMFSFQTATTTMQA